MGRGVGGEVNKCTRGREKGVRLGREWSGRGWGWGWGWDLGFRLVTLVALRWVRLVGWHTNSFIHPIIPSYPIPSFHPIPILTITFHFHYGTIHHITSCHITIQYNTIRYLGKDITWVRQGKGGGGQTLVLFLFSFFRGWVGFVVVVLYH